MEQGLDVGETDLKQTTGTVLGDHRMTVGDTVGLVVYAENPYLLSKRSLPPDPFPILPGRSHGASEILFRMLDITGSLIILTCALPIMLAAAILVKTTSKGPVLYRQERIGKGGKPFTLYKFRTMIDDAEKYVGPVWAARDDERVTPAGRILRRMRLDELPQLFNILKGDMSLVGPRPERPFFIARHQALQGFRLAVKPGLTGLAQVRAFYDLKPAHKVKYDYLYIQNRSLLLNLYILLQTIPVLFGKKGW